MLVALAIFGFAYLYQQNTSLKNELAQVAVSKQTQNTSTTEPIIENNVDNQKENGDGSILTAILFEATSSATLSPRAPIIVIIESATEQDASFNLNIKAFTTKATSYTAIDMPSLFSITEKDGTTIKTNSTTTIWKSMPPKSFVTGTLSFPLLNNQRTVLVQIDTGTETKFFNFDLDKKTYKEVAQ